MTTVNENKIKEQNDEHELYCWYCGGRLIKDDEYRLDESMSDYEGDVKEYHCEDCKAKVTFTRYDENEENSDPEYKGYECEDPEAIDRCPFCNMRMIWGSDFNYDEVHGEGSGEGITSFLHCSNPRCDAEAQYDLREEDDDPGEDIPDTDMEEAET